MTDSYDPAEVEFDFDPHAALALAAETSGWKITEELNTYVFLDGGSVDGHLNFETRVSVLPWSMTVGTRPPFALPASCAPEATRLCAALNRSIGGAAVAIAADGTPDVLSKAFLCGPELAAAAAISHAVKLNRQRAIEVTALLKRLADSETAEGIAADDVEGELLTALSAQKESVHPTLFDLGWLSRLTDAQMEDAIKLADARVSAVEETQSLIRLELLREAQLEGFRAAADMPVCVGPVLVHADGVAECYGCANPLAHLHPAGTSFQCRPDRAFGDGHRCVRCASSHGEQRWHSERRNWGAPAYEVAVARLQELLPASWVWQLQGSPDDDPRLWTAVTATPETLTLRLIGGARGGRAEVVVSDVDVPSRTHEDVTLFCVAANRAFTNWNIYLARSTDGEPGAGSGVERVVSAGGFHADHSRSNVPPEVIEAFALHVIRAAIVAAPAIRAIVDGATVTKALAIADNYFDQFDEPWLRTS